MKINNELSQRLFDLDRKEIANFIALFSALDVGDEYSSSLGKIVKTTDDTFKMIVTQKNYDNILEELINSDDDDIYNIFKSK